VQRKLRRSKDAFLICSLIPTHDPSNKQHQVRSVKRLIGKDHRCITIRQEKQLPSNT
jgi:hypothetical protein